MSLINKMLQELDSRQAMAAPDGKLPPRQVRAVLGRRARHEWFWRICAVLMVAAVAWVAWLVYQLQPRPLIATASAYKAAEQARRNPQPAASGAPLAPVADAARAPALNPALPATAVAAPASQPAASAPAPATARTEPAQQPMESFRLASSIATPIADRLRDPVAEKPAPARSAAAAKATAAPAEPARPPSGDRAPVSLTLDVPPTRIIAAPPAPHARVEKRERKLNQTERAEAEFRRAATLLNQGRVSDAEAGFVAALAADASHAAARQALVALLLEQRRIDEARRELQEALALNAAQPQFALVLARILFDRGDHAAAYEAIREQQSAASDVAEFHLLRGTILQRLARHAEAAEAYRSAVRAAPQSGSAWVGLGLSLEAMQARPEAAEAFRRALASSTLGAELRNFAEQRARLLQ